MIYIFTKILYLLVVIGFLFVMWLLWIKPVGATNNNSDFSITICHHTPANEVTHTFNNLQSYLGHLGTPHSGQTYDTGGVCGGGTPPPPPSPSSSPTPSPSVDPCVDLQSLSKEYLEIIPCPTETPSPEPSVIPTATPSATLVNNSQPQANGGTSEAPHVDCRIIKETPTIWEVKRNNPTSIHAKWSSVDPFVTHYKVEYSLGMNFWMWNTIVEGREVDLNFLPFNHILWIRVAGVSEGGCVGNFSEPIDP